jgi:hypothetical protein
MTTLSRTHNPGKQFSRQKYEFVYLFLVWYPRDITLTLTRAALDDDDDTQHIEMKICDKNQITHESETWTAVTGNSRGITNTNIFVEKPKWMEPAVFRRTILVAGFWEHGHETPDTTKDGESLEWWRNEYDLLQDSTAAFPELFSSRAYLVSKYNHVSSHPCSHKCRVSVWSLPAQKTLVG